LISSGQRKAKIDIEAKAPALASKVASQLPASPHPRSVLVSSAERGKEMRQSVKSLGKIGRANVGPF